MDENHTVKSGLTPLLKLFEKEYFYLRKLHSQIWVLKSGLLKPGLPVQFQMWDNTNIIQLSFKKYPFSCTNPCFRCFCRSLYVCKYISEGFPFCSIFLSWLKKKNKWTNRTFPEKDQMAELLDKDFKTLDNYSSLVLL